MPFLAFVMHQTATNHLSKLSGESSKIVPTLVLNCLRQSLSLHYNIRRLAMFPMRSQPHFGQVILPSGHRTEIMYRWHTSKSAKYRTASINVCGVLVSVVMTSLYQKPSCCPLDTIKDVVNWQK